MKRWFSVRGAIDVVHAAYGLAVLAVIIGVLAWFAHLMLPFLFWFIAGWFDAYGQWVHDVTAEYDRQMKLRH